MHAGAIWLDLQMFSQRRGSCDMPGHWSGEITPRVPNCGVVQIENELIIRRALAELGLAVRKWISERALRSMQRQTLGQKVLIELVKALNTFAHRMTSASVQCRTRSGVKISQRVNITS